MLCYCGTRDLDPEAATNVRDGFPMCGQQCADHYDAQQSFANALIESGPFIFGSADTEQGDRYA